MLMYREIAEIIANDMLLFIIKQNKNDTLYFSLKILIIIRN
jgi:hypothetical protein